MPQTLRILSKKYLNQLRNGKDFDLNPSGNPKTLIGGVIEKMKVVIRFAMTWSSDANQYKTITINSMQGTVNYPAGFSFIEDGFAVGDIFDVRDTNGPTQWSGEITAIFSQGQGFQYSFIGGTVNDGTFDDISVTPKATEEVNFLKGFNYECAMIENSEDFSTNSLISGNPVAYYSLTDVGGGSPRSTDAVVMKPQGSIRDWYDTGLVTIRFLYVSGYEQVFEITQELILNPWYLAGQLTDLINGVSPPYLAGPKSLKHVFQITGRIDINSPQKVKGRDNETGSVGFFNENFNGKETNYEVESIAYTDELAGPVPSLLSYAETTVNVIIKRKDGNAFPADTPVSIYVSYLPTNESEYKNTQTDLVKNFLYANAVAITDGLAVAGTSRITSLIAATESVTKIKLTARITYPLSEGSKLKSDDSYIIAVGVADQTITEGAGDRTILKADVNNYTLPSQNGIIDGLINIGSIDLFSHELTEGVDSPLPLADWEFWPEDGLLAKFKFSFDVPANTRLKKFNFILGAKNGEQFIELGRLSAAAANFQIKNNIQQIEIDSTRGYNLPDGSQFNFFKITTGSKVGDLQEYNCLIGQKLSWQDWRANATVPGDFYDNTKPNNNQNYLSPNYSDLLGFDIVLRVDIEGQGIDSFGNTATGSVIGDSDPLIVHPYNEDGGSPAVWSGTITTEDQSGNPLGGKILSNEPTIMKVTWVADGGAVEDLTGMHIIHRLEQEGNIGGDIYRASSLRADSEESPINSLTFGIVGDNVESESIIDNTLLPDGNVKLSARIFQPTAPPPAFNPNIYYGMAATGANAAAIQALSNFRSIKKDFPELAFTGDTLRYYFAFPDSYGLLARIEDENGFEITTGFSNSTLSFTEFDGAQTYRIYEFDFDTSQTNFKLSFYF